MRRFLVSLLCCIGLATIPNCTYGLPRIAVPSYVYPCHGNTGCAWDEFKTGASIVVVNPNSGPGATNDSFYCDYVNFLTTVKQNSTVLTVLGYVSTSYGNRDTSSVISDIDTYYQIYPQIGGIFLDEGSTSCDTTNLTTYKSYDDTVKSKGNSTTPQFTALNWGTMGPECYLEDTLIDTYVTFEGNYTYYISLSGAELHPDWMDKYVSSTWWHIVYQTPDDQNIVQAAVERANDLSAGYIYFTDAQGPPYNPYNVSASPTVWDAEVNATNSYLLKS